MTDPAANPYASPTAQDGDATLATPERGSLEQLASWLGAVAVNLPIPAMFASSITRDEFAVFGVIVGVLVVAGVGLAVVWMAPAAGRVASRGGYLLAISQFMPIGQMLAGAIGLSVASQFGPNTIDDDNGPFIEGFVGAFVATLTTAGVLIGAATFVGLLLRLLRKQTR